MKIVAITGPMGCGKSLAAKHLINRHSFLRHYFAKPLKEMIKCLGLTEEHVNGNLKETPCDELCGQTPRWAMQSIGTQWGRDLIHPNIWTNAWKNTLPDDNANIVCDDLRFPNEVDMLKKLNGTIVNIVRDGYKIDESHESESHILPFNHQVINNGSIEDLKTNLDNIIHSLI